MNPHHSVAARSTALWLLATALAGGAARVLIVDIGRASSSGLLTGTVEEAMTTMCEGALLACVGWVWLAITAVVLEALLTRRAGRSRHFGRSTRLPGVPRAWRRLVLVACGVAVTVGVALPAGATPGSVHLDPGGPHRRGEPATASLDGLPLPRRATDGASGPEPAAVPAPAPAPGGAGHVVVARGDSLWSIAADLLPADADDTWREIYRLNRDVVGDDPDLIVPGQRLALPPS